MSLFKYFCSLIGLATIFSCTPKSDIDGDFLQGFLNSTSNGNNVTFVKKKLKRVTSTDASGAVSIMNYTYSGEKLTNVDANDDGDISAYVLNYDTNNILKTITYTVVDKTSQTVVNTLDLTYDSSNVLTKANGVIKASGIETMKSVTNFSYDTAGNVNKIVTTYSLPDTVDPTKYVTGSIQTSDIKIVNSNVSTWKNTMATYIPGVTTPTMSVVNQTTVSKNDAYQNPANMIDKSFILASVHFGGTPMGLFNMSDNNFLNASLVTTTTGVPAVTTPLVFNYYYNNFGYPTIVTEAKGSRVVYEYY